MISISKGNTKIGSIPNISFPPIVTCNPLALCKDVCYAKKAYRMYPSVKTAWDNNLQMYQDNPALFFRELWDYISKHKPTRFRLHVSGDFVDQDYLNAWKGLAVICRETNFLAFTKRFDLDFGAMPSNFKLIASMWPGMEIPVAMAHFPKAWLSSDERKPVQYFKCAGGCTGCWACWDKMDEMDVVFDLH